MVVFTKIRMDILDVIYGAMVAGGDAAIKDGAKAAVKIAYTALRDRLAGFSKNLPGAILSLEENPDSAKQQADLKKELASTSAKLTRDADLIDNLDTLLEAIKESGLSGNVAGIDIDGLTVGGSAVIRNIRSQLKVKNTKVGGNFTIENVDVKKN